MSLILHIETSTTVCSVCLAKEGKLLALKEINNGYAHAENLNKLIEEVYQGVSYQVSETVAVAVSKGPGSYTGLRIGVSTAKGLAYGLSIPVIALDSMNSLLSHPEVSTLDAVKVPMLDAKRMEVYNGVYNQQGEQIRPIQAEVITETSFSEYWGNGVVVLFGPGADKCEALFEQNNHVNVIKEIFPSSSSMVVPAYLAFCEKDFVDTAYFEPYYLKDFIAGKPKKLL